MIEDCFFEAAQGGCELVDLTVGTSIGYLNLRGFFRSERTQKVARFAEIIDELK